MRLSTSQGSSRLHAPATALFSGDAPARTAIPDLPGQPLLPCPPTPSSDTYAQAQALFTTLAPLLAARRSMRLWSPEDGVYRAHAQQLTRRLPAYPAAVPLYLRGRTRLLALDFDAKHCGRQGVDNDVARCLRWIGDCGGKAIADRSTSGGRHVLIPLPMGIALTRADLEPLLRLLAEQLPSLDITPMLNPATGCITPPGSRCREGGFRELDGSLDDAVQALTVRSDAGFVPRLSRLLEMHDRALLPHDPAGSASAPCTVRATTVHTSRATGTAGAEASPLWEDSGDRARLRTQIRLRTPMPSAVRAFAINGSAPANGRWRARDGRLDRSAARQAVLAAAVLRGYCLNDIRAQFPAAGGTWAGFADAYHRYGAGADAALGRDWDAACRWANRIALEFRSLAHKSKEHTGGWWGDNSRTKKQARWLTAATQWVDAQWPRSPRRWSALAVLQALAYGSAIGGTVVRGVPIVELGGRSVSLMAAGIPETTVWQVLRELRDLPGSPILRTRRGAGLLADAYALVRPQVDDHPDSSNPAGSQTVRVEPVHPAWSILGLHCRRLYETVLGDQAATPTEAIAAARMNRSSGYAALATLTTAGLLTHTKGRIYEGPTTLDDIATAHGLPQLRRERISRHRQQRALWRAWLATRYELHEAQSEDQAAKPSRSVAQLATRRERRTVADHDICHQEPYLTLRIRCPDEPFRRYAPHGLVDTSQSPP
ncbi:hypothetical protein ACLMAL_32245 [Nocardia sp. CWNU-33]|uniref:hypothetical protein n=1 Tax=Nocardia sp. CWNU-33 TaxID=3392117 RepID=UPI00398F6FC7